MCAELGAVPPEEYTTPVPEGAPEEGGLSPSTEIAVLRLGLNRYADGLDDGGETAKFLLGHPGAARKALEAYQNQQALIVEMVREFLASPDHSGTDGIEREMDRLLQMRGAHSRPATGVVDARGSRRKH